MAEHTKGPWRVGVKNAGTDERTVDAEHYHVCTCHHHCVGSIEKEMEANARLIAAAPDMLEALERLVANLDEGDFVSTTRIDEASAAIAKAKGEA